MTDGEIEQLLRETHTTVTVLAERQIADQASAREWRSMVADKLDGVTARQDKTNGTVAAIDHKQTLQDGAMGVLQWLLTAVIGMTGAGAAVAGVVLALVWKGS